MSRINGTASVLCFCMGIMLINSCTTKNSKSNVERNETMNDQKKTKYSGTFEAKDKSGASILLEWIKLNTQSPEFAETLKSIGDVTATAYITVESGFLQANPDLKLDDPYLKQFEEFFKNGHKNVDWPAVEKKIYQVIKQFYSIDHSKFSAENIYFFVTAKDKTTREMLGAVVFFVMPEYPSGDIKCTSFAVAPSAQGRGLGKLLMSSIFRITQGFDRLFLCTRTTNKNALKVYRAWGFTKDLKPIPEQHFKLNPEHWASLEYKVDQSDILQKTASTLSDLK